jgi:thioredoxin 1
MDENTTRSHDGSDTQNGADLLSSGRCLLLVTARWCGVDRAVRDVVTNLALPDDVTRVLIDADRDPQTADRFDVQSLPALLVLTDGRVVARIQGSFGRPDAELFVRDGFSQRP